MRQGVVNKKTATEQGGVWRFFQLVEEWLIFPGYGVFIVEFLYHPVIFFVHFMRNFLIVRIAVKDTASQRSKLPDRAVIVF